MAQWLQALVALAEDLGSIPITHKMVYNSSREPNILFWPPWALCTNKVHSIHADKAFTHTKSIKLEKDGHFSENQVLTPLWETKGKWNDKNHSSG